MSVVEIARTDLALTEDEQAILADLVFEVDPVRGDYLAVQRNGEGILNLLRLLDARSAIPEHRVRWFTDGDVYPGARKRSLKEVFEGNGTRGDDIARHPSFWPVMRYFLNGPDLSPPIKQAFAEAVDRAGGEITGSEVNEVADAARRLTRAHRLKPHEASGEFHKLALEHGAHPMWAMHIYERVRTLRV